MHGSTTPPIHQHLAAASASRSDLLPRRDGHWGAFTARRWLSSNANEAEKQEPPPPGEESAAPPPPAGEQETPNVAAAEAAASGQEAGSSPPPASTTSRVEELENEIKSLKDQLLRSLADQDNTRRIAQRDVESARQFAIRSFAKALLDVSDNLTRALEAVPPEEVEQAAGSTLATLYEGIQMTERGLAKAFEANGLVKFGAVGDAFDPNHHEALFQYPDPAKPPGTVGQVMKAGFFLNKRVLRPAEVGVVNKPE
jgi:molecular chaperone GrpE